MLTGVAPLRQAGDLAMRQALARGVPHGEALLSGSKEFQEKMAVHCTKAVADRDARCTNNRQITCELPLDYALTGV